MTALPELDWWIGPAIGFGVALWSARTLLVRPSNRGLLLTDKARARDHLYQIAGTAFGFPSYAIPVGADSEERRRIRDLRTEHRRQTVKLHGWRRRTGMTAFTVAHPVDTDTSPGARARTAFEAMVRANLPCPADRRWTFEWPQGGHYVAGRLTDVLDDDARRAFDVLAPLLDYRDGVDPTAVLDVERADDGSIAAIDADLPKRFPVTQLDRRLIVQRGVDARLASPSGAWQHTWRPKQDRYRIAAAPPLPAHAPLPVDLLASWSDRDRIPFAVTHHGETVCWDTTDARSVHVLLAGATGAGKTTTGRAIVLAAILLGWDVRVCDPKRDDDWAWLASWSGAQVATTLPEMHHVITSTHQLMERRSAQRWDAATRRRSAPTLRPVLLYVDELADLFVLSRNKASNAARDADQLRGDCQYLFGCIAAKGRAPRVHVVGATQRPSAKVLDGDAKFNLQLRIGLGNLDPIASRIVFTNAAITDDHDLDDADGGDTPRGRGIVAPGSQLIDAQMYWISLDDANRALPTDVEVVDVHRTDPAPQRQPIALPSGPEVDSAGGDHGRVRRAW